MFSLAKLFDNSFTIPSVAKLCVTKITLTWLGLAKLSLTKLILKKNILTKLSLTKLLWVHHVLLLRYIIQVT